MAAFFGRPDVDGFMGELTAAQWREWEEYLDCEPWGGAHEDLRWGLLLSLLANRDRTKGPASAPGDWFPGLVPPDEGPREMTEAEVQAKALRWQSVARASQGRG